MLGAHAAHPAGKDLALLGDEPAEPGGVLVVDVVDVFDAEHADFLFGRPLGGTRGFHFFAHIKYSCLSEGKILVDGGEPVEIRAFFPGVVASGGEELHLVRGDLGDITAGAVGCLVASGLHGTAHSRLAALLEIAGTIFGLRSPDHDGQEIGLALAVPGVGAGDGESELAKAHAAAGGGEFGVSGQIADEENFVHDRLLITS